MSKNGALGGQLTWDHDVGPVSEVENIGVEPMTSCLQSRRSSQLS